VVKLKGFLILIWIYIRKRGEKEERGKKDIDIIH